MRKLAREAVIFALLGQLLATIGFFVRLDKPNRTTAREVAERAVHADFDIQPSADVIRIGDTVYSLVQIPLSNGTVLKARSCPKPVGKLRPLPPGSIIYNPSGLPGPPDCRTLLSAKDQVALGDADQVAIERDYWAAYKETRNISGSVLPSLFVGLWGFPSGLGLWGFYRLIYFAVKG